MKEKIRERKRERASTPFGGMVAIQAGDGGKEDRISDMIVKQEMGSFVSMYMTI